MPPQEVPLVEQLSRYYQAKPLTTINSGQIIFKKIKNPKHFPKALENNETQTDTEGESILR